MFLVGMIVASLVSVPAKSTATISRLYVDASAPAGGNGQSWATAYVGLQSALAEALARVGQNEVDEIWVAAGTYVPTTNPSQVDISFRIVPRTDLYGGFAGFETSLDQRDPVANPTILSGDVLGNDGPNFTNMTDNVMHVLWAVGSDIDNSTITDGFTITAGYSYPALGLPTHGAGFYVYAAGPTIRNCTFVANRSTSASGAVHLEFGINQDAPRVEKCRFEGNWTESGSGALGVSNQAHVTVEIVDCDFIGNESNGDVGAVGGSYLDVVRCRFIDNKSRYTAGGLLIAVEGNVVDCVFIGNHTDSFGGALYTSGDNSTGPLVGSRVQIVNCLFYGNTTTYDGAAIYSTDSRGTGPTITNCTIVGNTALRDGGGFQLRDDGNDPSSYSRPSVRNCIVWGNADQSGGGESAQIHIGNGEVQPSIFACDVEGWTGSLPGVQCFSADPQFVNPLGLDGLLHTQDDDYRLNAASPCVDRGMNRMLPRDLADQDRDGDRLEVLPRDLSGRHARILRSVVDVGAYEWGR